MSIHVNFSNMWIRLLYWKHHKWKNHETQSPTNQILKDKIGKKNQLHKMIWIRMKIELKKIRG
jgi:hypothetical protein